MVQVEDVMKQVKVYVIVEEVNDDDNEQLEILMEEEKEADEQQLKVDEKYAEV